MKGQGRKRKGQGQDQEAQDDSASQRNALRTSSSRSRRSLSSGRTESVGYRSSVAVEEWLAGVEEGRLDSGLVPKKKSRAPAKRERVPPDSDPDVLPRPVRNTVGSKSKGPGPRPVRETRPNNFGRLAGG